MCRDSTEASRLWFLMLKDLSERKYSSEGCEDRGRIGRFFRGCWTGTWPEVMNGVWEGGRRQTQRSFVFVYQLEITNNTVTHHPTLNECVHVCVYTQHD